MAGISKRLRRAFGEAKERRGSLRGRGVRRGRPGEEWVNRDRVGEVSMEEIQEFLEGGSRPPLADPRFKERLRGDLWELVQASYREGWEEER